MSANRNLFRRSSGKYIYQQNRVVKHSTWTERHQFGYQLQRKMEQNMRPQVPQSARVLYGNAENFARVKQPNEFQHYYERPLHLDAWCQTTVEDFGLIADEQRERTNQLQKENEGLLDKIRTLENDLRVHTDILISFNNQIQSTAALKTHANRISTEHVSPAPPEMPIVQDQYNSQNFQHTTHPNILPTSSYASPMPHVMNPLKTHCDSIKYTIVSNTNEQHETCEPIEIHLAEEDGALNLNNSADSGRLEICLNADEQQQQECRQQENDLQIDTVKEELIIPPNMPAQSGILVKRRKVVTQTSYNDESLNNQHQYNQTSNETQQSMSSTHFYETQQQVEQNDHVSQQQTPDALRQSKTNNIMIPIGPNKTLVPQRIFDSINWDNPSIATRKLLMAIFDRKTLATHSMTGKPSPAFRGQEKPQKKRLNPSATEDIIRTVSDRCKVSEKEVRNSITTKCADENKMMKIKMHKKQTQCNDSNKENYNK